MIVYGHLDDQGIVQFFLVLSEVLQELGQVIRTVLPEEPQNLLKLGGSKSAFKSLRRIMSALLGLAVSMLGQLSGLTGCMVCSQVCPQ